MREREPSRTALAVAAHRAAHQVLEGGRIFADPLALAVLGASAEAVRETAPDPSRTALRLFVCARSALAEAWLADGVERGRVSQAVVLGAGLDTFGCRSPFPPERLRVFEVDHPATQAWKRRRLEEAGIAVPPALRFAPVDFERDDLLARLVEAGLAPDRRTFFTWLGVVPYLTQAAISATLATIAGLPGGAEVAFDYGDPPDTLSPAHRAAHEARAARVAAAGEPFVTYLDAATLHPQLRAAGFTRIEDLGPPALAARFGQGAGRPIPERGGHVLWAATG